MVTAVTVTVLLGFTGVDNKACRGKTERNRERKASFHRMPIPKQLCAYTQTIVRLYPISNAKMRTTFQQRHYRTITSEARGSLQTSVSSVPSVFVKITCHPCSLKLHLFWLSDKACSPFFYNTLVSAFHFVIQEGLIDECVCPLWYLRKHIECWCCAFLRQSDSFSESFEV